MIPACDRLYIPFGGGLVAEIIMLDDIFSHVSDAKAHVLVSGHRGIEIKILDVHCHEFCSGG